MDEYTLPELIDKYCELEQSIKPALEQISVLKQMIKDAVLELGHSVETEKAKVTIRNGYTRSSWDDKKLRGFAIAHPEIMECCKESEVKPTVNIKVL